MQILSSELLKYLELFLLTAYILIIQCPLYFLCYKFGALTYSHVMIVLRGVFMPELIQYQCTKMYGHLPHRFVVLYVPSASSNLFQCPLDILFLCLSSNKKTGLVIRKLVLGLKLSW